MQSEFRKMQTLERVQNSSDLKTMQSEFRKVHTLEPCYQSSE